jgi:hypothetical protein
MSDIKTQYSQLLGNLSKLLDISPNKYKEAVERYTAVGNWLNEGVFEGCNEKPIIYPQGSFRLGTIVRPIKNGEESDYDIDLVCTLPILKTSTTPEKIKSMVGARLKENTNYKRMLDDEGCRCWTINYAEKDGIGFHIDILPSVPEDKQIIGSLSSIIPLELANQAIAITHRRKSNEYQWLSSNPRGYANWFDQINKPSLNKIEIVEKQLLFESHRDLFEKVEDVPIQLIKTPLQRAIQILKRHRDLRFAGHPLENEKPISMIITTLAAKLYQNEGDVYLTLKNIVEKLTAHASLLQPGVILEKNLAELHLITKRSDGTWYIPNPVNPNENFADRWHEDGNKKARAFFEWVSWVRNDLVDILSQPDITKISKNLEQHFGQGLIKEAMANIPQVAATSNFQANVPTIQIKPSKPWRH